MTRTPGRLPILAATALCLVVASLPDARAERLPLPAKGAKLVEAHSYLRSEPVMIVRSQDYTTWLEWTAVPDTEIAFETRKPGIVDVRYVFTSDFNIDEQFGPAGIAIEVDGIRNHTLETDTSGFSTDVDALPLGESYSLGQVLRGGGQFTLGGLAAIPAGRHTVRIVLRPAGNIFRFADGLHWSASTTRLRHQSLSILVYG